MASALILFYDLSEGSKLHSGFDLDRSIFFVEMLYHPEFAGKPLAVGGDPEARHGIVLTANYIAKKQGVKTGMALCQARQEKMDKAVDEIQEKLWKEMFWSRSFCLFTTGGVPGDVIRQHIENQGEK